MEQTIKVGPMVYQVEEVEGLSSDGQTLFGQVKYGECKILLEGRNDPQQRLQTVWHEIVHVILMQVGLTKEARREELVDPLAYGIVQVLQDNRWLVEGEEGPLCISKLSRRERDNLLHGSWDTAETVEEIKDEAD